MSVKRKNTDKRTGHSSSQWLSPNNPQTGDGKTTRDIYDRPVLRWLKGQSKDSGK